MNYGLEWVFAGVEKAGQFEVENSYNLIYARIVADLQASGTKLGSNVIHTLNYPDQVVKVA